MLHSDYIGFFDMSGLEDGVEYELCLKVTDKAGNVTTTVKDVTNQKMTYWQKELLQNSM